MDKKITEKDAINAANILQIWCSRKDSCKKCIFNDKPDCKLSGLPCDYQLEETNND